jgi:hypothetical protein
MIKKNTKTTHTYLLNLPKSYSNRIPIAPVSNTWHLPANAGRIAIVNDRDLFKTSPKPVLFINQDVNIKPAIMNKDDFEKLQLITEKISSPKTQTVLMEKSK